MLDNRNNKSGWFVAGLGLGVLAGILCAPKSGRETRKAIAAGVDNGFEHLTAFGRDARERVSHIVESGKKSLTRKKEQVGAAVDTAKKFFTKTA
jgi:gas vesicle protein